MNPEDQREEVVTKMVDDFVIRVGEHVESVQVFVSYQSESGETTRSYTKGMGNLHARHGHVREWMLIQEEYAREWARNHAEDERDNE